jgi:hypothetical protein
LFSSRASQASPRPVLPPASSPSARPLSARLPAARSRRLRAALGAAALALLAAAGEAVGGGLPAPAPAAALAGYAQPAPASVGPARAKEMARAMLGRYHWSARRQFPYLLRLWNRESGWRVRAYNRASGADGIPQADPGRRMASAGPHWRTDARTQITWGLRYIRHRYGSPRAAWAHEVRRGWY